MKKILIVLVIVFLTSCQGVLWDGVPKAADESTPLTIAFADPLLVYMVFYDDYLASEDYMAISFTDWLIEYTNYFDNKETK